VAVLAVVLYLKYVRPPAIEEPAAVNLPAPPPTETAAINPAVIPPPPTPSVESQPPSQAAKADTNANPAVAAPPPTAKPAFIHSRALRDTAPNINFTPNYDGSQNASVARIENGPAAVEDKWIETGKVEAAHAKGNEIWCFEIVVGDSGAVSSKEMNVTPQQFVLLDLGDATYRGDACQEQQGGELHHGEKLRVSICFELPAKSTPKQLLWNPPIVFASTRQPAQCSSQWLAKKEIFKQAKMSE